MKWENYLQANTIAENIDKSLKRHSNTIAEDIGTSLKRHSSSINSSISNASQKIIGSNIASQKEITRVLQYGFDDAVDAIGKVGESVESLRADFNYAMGEVLWKLELVQGTLTDILNEIRLAEFEREARSLRERAEDAYKNGWYKESLSDFLEVEKLNYQDFAVLFSIANIYFYHSTECEDDYKEPSMEKALAYYLKSAKYSAPKSRKHAAKSYLFSGWICYLLEKDKEALDYTSKAIELNPDLAEACFQKAKILMCLNAPDKALMPLRKAIEISRDYSIKAIMDPDFKNYDTEVQRLLDEMRTEAQKVAQEALADAEDQIKNITKIVMGGGG
jgi:tetratricopeptide (TPR) repeat protein